MYWKRLELQRQLKIFDFRESEKVWDWRNSYSAFQHHASETRFIIAYHIPDFYLMIFLTYDSKQFVFKSDFFKKNKKYI